jgi:hypothetical protein
MRGLLLAAALASLTTLTTLAASATPSAAGLRMAPAKPLVMHVDYYWHHHHWNHRYYGHGYWHYW